MYTAPSADNAIAKLSPAAIEIILLNVPKPFVSATCSGSAQDEILLIEFEAVESFSTLPSASRVV